MPELPRLATTRAVSTTRLNPEGRTFRIPGRSDGDLVGVVCVGAGPEKVLAAAAQIKPSNHHVVKLVTFSSPPSVRLNTAACIIEFSPDISHDTQSSRVPHFLHSWERWDLSIRSAIFPSLG